MAAAVETAGSGRTGAVEAAGSGRTGAVEAAGFRLAAAVGARLCNEQARSDRDCGRKKCGWDVGKKADSGGLVAA